VKNPFLIGQQIYLRPLERADALVVAAWFNDPEVNRTLRRYLPLMLQTEEAFLDKLAASEENVVLGIMVRQTDQFIGVTGLNQIDPKNRNAAFGITIGEKNEWGKGYGTEATRLMVKFAFETLNLHRVWLHVYEYNPRGLHAYEKVGFRVEGRLRQDTYREGRYWDTITMGILRDEWVAQAPSS